MKYAIPQVVLILLFFFSLGFWIYHEVKTEYFNPIVIAIPILLLTIIFATQYGEYLGTFYKVKNFITRSGCIGAIVRNPAYQHGNQVTYTVSVYNRYVPKNYKYSIMGTIGSFLSCTTIMHITADRHKFHDIRGDNCEAPEGAVFFEGRLDGAEIEDSLSIYRSKISEQSQLLQRANNVLETVVLDASNLAKMRNLDIDSMSEFLKTVADRVKRVQVMTRGSGGLEMLDDNIGGE